MLVGSRLTARQGRFERVTGLSLGLVVITVVILVVRAAISEPVVTPWVLAIFTAPIMLGAGLVVLVITFGAFLIIDRLVDSDRWATWLGFGAFVLAWACVLGVEFGSLRENFALVTVIFGGEALVYVLGLRWVSGRQNRSRRRSDAELTHAPPAGR